MTTQTTKALSEQREETVRNLLIKYGFGHLSFDQGLREVEKILKKATK